MSYINGITLITPTGNRQLAFERCQYYIQRQTVQPNQWIMVNDGDPESIGLYYQFKSINLTLLTEPNYPVPHKSFRRNIRVALQHVLYDKIIIIEDDDWYHPTYIEECLKRFEDYELIGQPFALYYHVGRKRWRINQNDKRASFCETAFRADLIPVINKVLEYPSPFVDQRLWEYKGREIHKKLYDDKRLVVGIKGMPGRKGIGIGHNPPWSYKHDPDWSFLRETIGREDANWYITMKKKGLI